MKNETLAELSLLAAPWIHAAQCLEDVTMIDIDQLSDDAMKRLAEHIARSTGQHKRAIRAAFEALRREAK